MKPKENIFMIKTDLIGEWSKTAITPRPHPCWMIHDRLDVTPLHSNLTHWSLGGEAVT